MAMLQQLQPVLAQRAWGSKPTKVPPKVTTAALSRRSVLGEFTSRNPSSLDQHLDDHKHGGCNATLGHSSDVPCHAGGLCCCSSCACSHRSQWYDKYFAYNMAVGMTDYEAAILPVKQQLFKQLFTAAALQQSSSASRSDNDGSSSSSSRPFQLLEVGIGTGAQHVGALPAYSGACRWLACSGQPCAEYTHPPATACNNDTFQVTAWCTANTMWGSTGDHPGMPHASCNRHFLPET